MTVTTNLAACSQTVSANGPDGAVDPPSTLDDAIRYALSFIAQLRDTKAALGANGDITALSALASINGGPLAGFRNRIINGNFANNQRGVSGTVTLAAGAYGHDRWKAGAGGATYTFAASGADTIITVSAGSMIQTIEGANVEGGGYTLSHAGNALARTAVNGTGLSGLYTAAPQATASASGGQNISIEFATGTISKVQLEFGTVVSQFERRSIGAEDLLCKRYFQLFRFDVGESYGAAANNSSKCTALLAQMRAAPSTAENFIGGSNVSAVAFSSTAGSLIATYTVASTGAWSRQATISLSAEL